MLRVDFVKFDWTTLNPHPLFLGIEIIENYNVKIEITAVLVKTPKYYFNKNKQQTIKSLKGRFLSARRIPYSFIKPNGQDGGWYVRTSNWRLGPRYYHVYKTVHGIWLCTCDDFVIYGKQICKHIIAVVLSIHNKEEKTDRLDRILREAQSGIFRENLY